MKLIVGNRRPHNTAVQCGSLGEMEELGVQREIETKSSILMSTFKIGNLLTFMSDSVLILFFTFCTSLHELLHKTITHTLAL